MSKEIREPIGLREAAHLLCTSTRFVRNLVQMGHVAGRKNGVTLTVCAVSCREYDARRWEKLNEAPRSGVYVIRAEEVNRYKIGHASDIERRVRKMRVESPVHLTLIAHVPAWDAKKTERRLHKRFAEYRIRGEWFRESPELLEFCGGYAVGDIGGRSQKLPQLVTPQPVFGVSGEAAERRNMVTV